MNKVVNVTIVRKGGEEANEWWITTRGLKVPVLPAGGLATLVEEKKNHFGSGRELVLSGKLQVTDYL